VPLLRTRRTWFASRCFRVGFLVVKMALRRFLQIVCVVVILPVSHICKSPPVKWAIGPTSQTWVHGWSLTFDLAFAGLRVRKFRVLGVMDHVLTSQVQIQHMACGICGEQSDSREAFSQLACQSPFHRFCSHLSPPLRCALGPTEHSVCRYSFLTGSCWTRSKEDSRFEVSRRLIFRLRSSGLQRHVVIW
jgi:hypothetical protein